MLACLHVPRFTLCIVPLPAPLETAKPMVSMSIKNLWLRLCCNEISSSTTREAVRYILGLLIVLGTMNGTVSPVYFHI